MLIDESTGLRAPRPIRLGAIIVRVAGVGKEIARDSSRANRALADIRAVDVDVTVAEVAGPDAGRSRATGQVESHLEVALAKRRFGAGARARHGRSATEYRHAADVERNPVGIEAHAGVSGSAEDAAPVQLFPVEGCLHERRVRDSLGHRAGLLE